MTPELDAALLLLTKVTLGYVILKIVGTAYGLFEIVRAAYKLDEDRKLIHNILAGKREGKPDGE